jgi:mannose-1-phosphate guanylyltransferase
MIAFSEIAEPEQFVVITYRKYFSLVKDQLPDLKDHQIFSEPNRKNTATCIAYAGYKIFAQDPNAILIVTPADHLIFQEKKFIQSVEKAVEEAQAEKRLITIGIKPNRPETGYGYIQYLENKGSNALKVKTFTEKPNSKLAKAFLESGDFVWNSGMFVWKASSLIHAFEEYMPDVAEVFEEAMDSFGTDKEQEQVAKAYLQVKNISIDYGIMEKSNHVYVILGEFGWSDLGSWNSLHEIREKDENNNVVEANALLYDTAHCYIKANQDKLVVVQGLENYLVSETDNVLLVCKLDDERKFRDFVSNARKKGEDFV